MRVVYFGSGDFAVPSLRALTNGGHEVVAVVTQPDRPAGRGKRVMRTPVAQRAEIDGIEAIRCDNVNDDGFVDRMRALKAEIGVVAAFGQKMSEPVRSAFGQGCINIHASLLPKYRGAAPINHAILEGEQRTGVTVFRLVDRMDAGPILLTRQTAIGPFETAGELHDRLAGIGCDAIKAALELLAAEPDCPGEPQDESLATTAPKLTKSDGWLRFDTSAERIVNCYRAMTPWPGARCSYVPAGGEAVEVTITSAAALPMAANEPPGTITPTMTVATADGLLEIHGIKPAGKREMSWQDFVNGRRVQPGERFESLDKE